VLLLQVRARKSFFTVSANTLDLSQMSLIHMPSEVLLPDDT